MANHAPPSGSACRLERTSRAIQGKVAPPVRNEKPEDEAKVPLGRLLNGVAAGLPEVLDGRAGSPGDAFLRRCTLAEPAFRLVKSANSE